MKVLGQAGLVVATVLRLLVCCAPVSAGDWPQWRYDAERTAASPDDLPEELELRWTRHQSPRQQVWDDPLNDDLMPYDRLFEPIIVGHLAVVGYNDRDKVVAFDLETGDPVWTFYTGGPVRLPPTAWRDRVFVGSDDGYLYCLRATDGALVWKIRGGPSARKVLGNKRVISMWPVRGGPVVRDDHVYFAASIWPFMGTFLYALDADTGAIEWVNDGSGAQYLKQPHNAPAFGGVAPQGALVATGHALLVPGGRSVPAVFDRRTGKLEYFHLAQGGKGTGGSLVLSDNAFFYVHTRRRGVRQFHLNSGKRTEVALNEPVLAGKAIYTATDTMVRRVDAINHEIWRVAVDGSGDLILAGHRLYAAGEKAISAIELRGATRQRPPKVVWSIPVKGHVERLLAGGDTLLAVTREGDLHAFGRPAGHQAGAFETTREPIEAGREVVGSVDSLLQRTGAHAGYAFVYGIDGPELFAALAQHSDLRIVAVDADRDKVAGLRTRLDAAGWYGTRIAVHQGDPLSFRQPPLIASLIVVGRAEAAKFAQGAYRSQHPAGSPARSANKVARSADPPGAQYLKRLYTSLRPYGGTLVFPLTGTAAASLERQVAAARLAKAKVVRGEKDVLVIRQGALPGAAPWTHEYGNIANTVKSDDQRVKAPLGLLWFGGNSNMDVLPRHGHGPPPQVIGGRLFIEGINRLSARDVYTGRVLWKRAFPDLRTLGVYYDKTYQNRPLDPSYNQVHIPGANVRGTNVVATRDAVYLVVGRACLVLDAATGETRRVIALPKRADGQTGGRWTFVGVYGDTLLAGTDFAHYEDQLDSTAFKPSRKRGAAWNPDLFATLGLTALDRKTGKKKWSINAHHSFLINGIVAGGGRVYLLDKLPKSVETQLARRGRGRPKTYRLLALDATNGHLVWEKHHDVFGTWLGYSESHDTLLQAGAAAKDRGPDEVGQGMITYRGKDGQEIWRKTDRQYAGPCILHNDVIITNANSYEPTVGAFRLRDGSQVMVTNPLTGREEPWRFVRAYGCNTAVASEHLITFRSGAASYYDLDSKSGTLNMGGFRSGCSSNLIAADGVLNAPDYTRTCSCAYQNQTSVGLIYMPDVEVWSVSRLGTPKANERVERVGVNFGAPGDRRTSDGGLWLEYPVVAGKPSQLAVQVGGGSVRYFHHHASRIKGGDLPWVTASGAIDLRRLAVRLGPEHTGHGSPARRYTVRLLFAEPDDVEEGDRVFDVSLQGRVVVRGLDVVKKAGGRFKGIVGVFHHIRVDQQLVIELAPRAEGKQGPLLCGVECIAE